MEKIGILWDLDGVLVDTGEFHYQAWAETCSIYGLRFDRDTFRRTFGMNNAGIVAVLAGDGVDPGRVAEISDCKERLFRNAIRGQVQLLSGVEAWLQQFQEAGMPQAIASSAPLANVEVIVDELGLREVFEALVSGAQMPGKPDPAVFLEASRRIGLSQTGCLVIEDSVAGVEAARRGGMKCVAVTTTNPRALLGGAHLVLESLEHLSWKAIQDLFGEPTLGHS
ncbi:MAG: HAD family phosphatase [Acidobacteriota bacterium]